MPLICPHYEAWRCRSCTLIPLEYPDQLASKEASCRALMADVADPAWEPAVASAPAGFRNKAKLVVGGTAADPTLGVLDRLGAGVDLRDCALYPADLRAAFDPLAAFIERAGLMPYDVPARRGELKNVLVTVSPDGELMVRFVLRSTEALPRIRKYLPALLADLPQARVVSANLLPEHKAVVEGEQEVLLTEQTTLRMRVNGLDLHLRPQSFFQTNTEVAAALYRQGRQWVDRAGPAEVWDLYCGVGGFALHVAGPGRRVTGVEVSAEAVASAEQSRDEAGLTGVRFLVGDATEAAEQRARDGGRPDLVVVNPPRRGIGPRLAGWLESSGVPEVVYSSCNAQSMARDLAAMPSLRATRARVLDMFPQTDHYEVMVALSRR